MTRASGATGAASSRTGAAHDDTIATDTSQAHLDPRVARSRARVLGAALDLVAGRGIHGATVEAIAARSTVAKTTIYRQWPNQAALLLDAFHSIAADPPLPDSGSVLTDLNVLVGGFAEAMGQGRVAVFMAALIEAAEHDPAFAALHQEEAARRHQQVMSVLQHGVDRRELPADTDLLLLVDLLAGPVLYRRFISGLPLNRAFGEQVVHRLLGRL